MTGSPHCSSVCPPRPTPPRLPNGCGRPSSRRRYRRRYARRCSRHTGYLGDDVAVAVRSSATAEDLAFASFAGQQDTYLNVVGADALVDAVRRCWASLWTDRAVDYRTQNGIDHGSVRLAVVVQQMVQATGRGPVHRGPGDRDPAPQRYRRQPRGWARLSCPAP